MTQTYRSMFTGKELDAAIIGMRSLVTPPLTIYTVLDTATNTIFSFDRKVNNFVKLSIVGLGDAGATYLECNVTCGVVTTPTILNSAAVTSGTLSITAPVVDLNSDIVRVKVSAPIGTVIKIQPIQII